MSQFDAFTKAKKAAEQAAQTAAGVRESAAAKAAELREKATLKSDEAKALAVNVREQASSRVGELRERLTDKVAEIKDAAIASMEEMADDLNQHLPALREAGYTLTHVAFEVGIAPKVKANFTTAPDISQERVDAVIEEHKEARATVALLRALFAAYKLQHKIRIAGMHPRDIELELGIAPAAIVKFA